MLLKIYCDGSCRNNGAKDAVGAWGFIALDRLDNIKKVEHQVEYNTTNQRMELQAALEACMYAELKILTPFDEIHIYTDSAYLHNCYNAKWYEKWEDNGWLTSKKQPVLNADLWKRLIFFFKDAQFTFHKVPGHQNNKWNNYIDKIVQDASAQAKETQMNVNNN